VLLQTLGQGSHSAGSALLLSHIRTRLHIYPPGAFKDEYQTSIAGISGQFFLLKGCVVARPIVDEVVWSLQNITEQQPRGGDAMRGGPSMQLPLPAERASNGESRYLEEVWSTEKRVPGKEAAGEYAGALSPGTLRGQDLIFGGSNCKLDMAIAGDRPSNGRGHQGMGGAVGVAGILDLTAAKAGSGGVNAKYRAVVTSKGRKPYRFCVPCWITTQKWVIKTIVHPTGACSQLGGHTQFVCPHWNSDAEPTSEQNRAYGAAFKRASRGTVLYDTAFDLFKETFPDMSEADIRAYLQG